MKREYWTTIEKLNSLLHVFIDETGINLAMTRRYARAKKGHRAYSQCSYNRGKNVTLIGAIATLGFLAPFTFEESTNKEAFLTYATELLAPQLWTGMCASNG